MQLNEINKTILVCQGRKITTSTNRYLFSYTVVDKYLFYKFLSDSINEGVFIKIDVFRFYLWIKYKICLPNCIYAVLFFKYIYTSC